MMFFEGMNKPWWIAGLVVWLVTLVALEQLRGFEFTTAARIALVVAAVVTYLVWFAVGRGRGATPPSE
jgi:hypothetical protein